MYYYKKKDMYIFSDEEKQQAHNISVIDYLQRVYGFSFKKSGQGYRCVEHDSLVIKANEKLWYWNSLGMGGGDIIEFVMKYEHISYDNALKRILNPTVSSDNYNYKQAPKNIVHEKHELKMPPKKQGKYNRVFAYLTKTRCIDRNIINLLFTKRLIYEDANHGNCVFVGYNKEGKCVYANIHTTMTESKFKGDVYGADKNNGFYIKGINTKKVYVFEAPIDLLSHATICNIAADNCREWLKCTRLALGGVSDNALEHFLKEYPEVEEICFCLDSDGKGMQAIEKYMLKYAAKGYKVTSQPPKLKDYNEDLVYMVKNCNSRCI